MLDDFPTPGGPATAAARSACIRLRAPLSRGRGKDPAIVGTEEVVGLERSELTVGRSAQRRIEFVIIGAYTLHGATSVLRSVE
ncbi:hypothetical protein ACFTWF_05215 [Rhodococcus sp. NPDC056960]|uniref:hypothetical protein n=1 Tax=Rhodococcus sp. NPDC056960 TaxID=3345982 RepID=UPI00362B50A8